MARWKSVAEAFIPYRRMNFLLEIYETIRKINFEKDKAAIKEIRQLYYLLFAQGIYCLVMALTPNKTRFQQLITFNFAGYHRMPAIIDVEIFLLWVCLLVITHVLFYVALSNSSVNVLIQVLWDGHFYSKSSNFLLGSTIRMDIKVVQFLNIYQVFTVCLDLMIMITYVQFMWIMFADYHLDIIERVLSLICFHVCFALFMSGLVLLAYVGSILSCFAIAAFYIFFARLNSMTTRIRNLNNFTLVRLMVFIRHQVNTLEFLVNLNKLFGSLLTTFLVTTLPLNGTVFSFFVNNDDIALPVYVMLGIFLFGMGTGMVAMHYLAGRFNQRFHRDYKQVMALNVRLDKRRYPIRYRLRIANSIQAFHVKKKYGITYQLYKSPLGLISMFAFFKFFILFSEYTMYNLSNVIGK